MGTILFEVGELPPEGNTAAWRRLIRLSAGARPHLLRAGWRCTDPADGVRVSELWVSPDGSQRQVLFTRPPLWSLPPEAEWPERGSGDWLRLVTRGHRERDLMRSQPGWRCTYRRPAESPVERWEHVTGVEVLLPLWTHAMRTQPDPGEPPRPARIAERYRYGWEVADEGRRWLGAVDTAGHW